MIEDGGRHLGPRKRWDDDRKRHAAPWHRHLPWLLPVAACGVFLILIVGALGVRRIIRVTRPAPAADNAAQQSPSIPSVTADVTKEQLATAVTESDRESGSATVKSEAKDKKPTLEILPPLAAQEPGRKLPKMLVVGDQPDMFPSVAQALQVAVSGDIIEIRTNRPMLVAGIRYEAKDKERGDELTIRGGIGFAPVLRMGVHPLTYMLEFRDTRVSLQRLHFVTNANQLGCFVALWGGTLAASSCSFTAIESNGQSRWCISLGADDLALQKDPTAFSAKVSLKRCFIRGGTINTVACRPLVASIEMADCLVATATTSVCFPFYHAPTETSPNIRREIVLNGNTLPAEYLMTIAPYTNNRVYDSFISVQARSNVFASSDVVLYQNDLERPLEKLFGSHYLWTGQDNLFVPGSGRLATAHRMSPTTENTAYRSVSANLREWNEFWGGRADTGSEIDTVPFVKEIDWQNFWKSLPSDYQLRPTGAVERLARRGVRVGCDLTRLPVPPPITLEPYEAPPYSP